ncbi:secondary thiamine-phosphate synthase enzyme YjbQ [Haladaptatus salinisoli]|uniref:secondary thiamine-phosphate synthase enzyme YjbQ n=1 Tax=Haladaptatus salinisoli TaxID=2884876 RepID=UPI001D0B26C4|nr:secondary thiamine-phosphate synthase enzyme YjbQ [Haladaptatus salinisoli]
MEFEVRTEERVDVVNITDRVAECVADSADAGTCTVFVPHTTAEVVVNEDEPRLLADLETALSRLIPESDDYRHDRTDDNADAHLRATVLGEHATIPVEDGELRLGTWQSILFVECDGPRTRRVVVR